jgi:hypothetical protein
MEEQNDDVMDDLSQEQRQRERERIAGDDLEEDSDTITA